MVICADVPDTARSSVPLKYVTCAYPWSLPSISTGKCASKGAVYKGRTLLKVHVAQSESPNLRIPLEKSRTHIAKCTHGGDEIQNGCTGSVFFIVRRMRFGNHLTHIAERDNVTPNKP